VTCELGACALRDAGPDLDGRTVATVQSVQSVRNMLGEGRVVAADRLTRYGMG
jgi:hypothetical protein